MLGIEGEERQNGTHGAGENGAHDAHDAHDAIKNGSPVLPDEPPNTERTNTDTTTRNDRLWWWCPMTFRRVSTYGMRS